jgi:hypothetical protein
LPRPSTAMSHSAPACAAMTCTAPPPP